MKKSTAMFKIFKKIEIAVAVFLPRSNRLKNLNSGNVFYSRLAKKNGKATLG